MWRGSMADATTQVGTSSKRPVTGPTSIGEVSAAITPMPPKTEGAACSSESDQLVADGLVLSVPPSSARKS
jgi:hypothetical protein